jgi:hypothetical protein
LFQTKDHSVTSDRKRKRMRVKEAILDRGRRKAG